jgi:NADH:ubiquinone oxidoreductase subunit 5 (subunit L)/multisubunit Na+/H+ antiporter MnhA subunit
MAYSSINNVGFILIGLAAGTAQGASARLVYLAIYVPMTVGGFIAVLMLKDENGNPVDDIRDIAGLSRHRKVLAACLMMVMFSLAGIPPLFGFWGKFVVFQAAVQAGFFALAAVGIAASVIGAFYYIKVVKIMYLTKPAIRSPARATGPTGNPCALRAVHLASGPAHPVAGRPATRRLRRYLSLCIEYLAETGSAIATFCAPGRRLPEAWLVADARPKAADVRDATGSTALATTGSFRGAPADVLPPKRSHW